MQVQTMIAFLKARGWKVVATSDKFYTMQPPEKLNFEVNFRLEIPLNEKNLTFNRYMLNLTEGISDVYDIKKEYLEGLFSKTLEEIKTERKLTKGMLAFAS